MSLEFENFIKSVNSITQKGMSNKIKAHFDSHLSSPSVRLVYFLIIIGIGIGVNWTLLSSKTIETAKDIEEHSNKDDRHMTLEKSKNFAVMSSEFEISKETQLKLREDVNLNITNIAVLNTKLEYISDGIDEIKGLIKNGGN